MAASIAWRKSGCRTMTSLTASAAVAARLAEKYARQSKFGVAACSAVSAILLYVAFRSRRRARRILLVRKREQLRDVVRVRLSNADELFVPSQIVIAVRHAESRLRDEHGIDIRALRILSNCDGDRQPDARPRGAREGGGKVLARRNCIDRRELAGERLDAARLDARFVREAFVEAADLLIHRAGRRWFDGFGLENPSHRFERPLAEHCERAVVRPVRWDGRPVDPRAVDEAEKVVLRPNRSIHA